MIFQLNNYEFDLTCFSYRHGIMNYVLRARGTKGSGALDRLPKLVLISIHGACSMQAEGQKRPPADKRRPPARSTSPLGASAPLMTWRIPSLIKQMFLEVSTTCSTACARSRCWCSSKKHSKSCTSSKNFEKQVTDREDRNADYVDLVEKIEEKTISYDE